MKIEMRARGMGLLLAVLFHLSMFLLASAQIGQGRAGAIVMTCYAASVFLGLPWSVPGKPSLGFLGVMAAVCLNGLLIGAVIDGVSS